MFGLRPQELLIIFGIVILLFGAKKLPELARGLGSSMREFRRGIADSEKDEHTDASNSTEASA